MSVNLHTYLCISSPAYLCVLCDCLPTIYVPIHQSMWLSTCTSVYLFIHSSMALQPFAGPRPLLQFRNLFLHSQYDSLDGVSARREAATYTQKNITQNKRTHARTHTPNIHALSGIQTHDLGFRESEDSAFLRPLGYISFLICLCPSPAICVDVTIP
jgi:hypothetical protein